MTDRIVEEWNRCYKMHKCTLCKSSASVHESKPQAKVTDLTINLKRAISLPSSSFESFNHWQCFSDKNCDGLFLVEVLDGVYDLVAVELKSTFSTEHLFEAKEQVCISLQKSRVLLNTLSSFSAIRLRHIYGIIVSLPPDDGALSWISHFQELAEDNWGNHTVGLSLFLYGSYTVEKTNSDLCDNVCPSHFDLLYYNSKDASLTIDLPKP